MSMGRHAFSLEAAIGSAAHRLLLEQKAVIITAPQSKGEGESRWDHYGSLWEVVGSCRDSTPLIQSELLIGRSRCLYSKSAATGHAEMGTSAFQRRLIYRLNGQPVHGFIK
ncbi:hypothetical protein XENOCAPTIV_021787 [Xenoophorus captivus]|uniref:Uncharacterized protein n=1 Tax=Xenoophorus captivus TaxID=1517983 RepID=A0ABV0QW47_9TELE